MAGNAAMTIFIGGDNSDFLKKWEGTRRALKRGLGSEAMAASESIATGFAGVVAAMGVLGAASVKMAGEMQASKRAFTTLLGDSQKAEKLLGDLAKFAAETPFDLPGLTTASKKLLAFGFAAEDIIPIMASIGDAAAMLGIGQEGIDRLTLAIGQMQAKGKVSGEEMRQLAEAGIPAWKFLADAIGVSIPQAMDMASKGAIDSTTGINAVLMGMQQNFKGGMEGLSKEIPGLFSTIQDNVGAIGREIGDKLIEQLDIKNRMQSLADSLGNFAEYVKSNGLNEALKNLIPKELSLAIFVVAGALASAAIPALVSFAISVWTAMVPLLPFIAAGAALGAVAWVIWQAWEPLGDLFGSVWTRAAAYVQQKWAEIKTTIFSGVQSVFSAMQPLLNLFGGGLQQAVSGWMASLAAKVSVASKEAAAAAEQGKAASDGISQALGGIGDSLTQGAAELQASVAGVSKEFTGLHGKATAAGEATGKAAKEAAKEWDKLEKKADQVSKAIEDQWVQTTKTELEQLDLWRAQQLKALDETKAANENYQRDVTRVAATYSVRRRKIVEEEARNIAAIYRGIADNARQFSQDATSINLKGSAAKEFDITSGSQDKIRDMERYFEDMASKWNTATETEKKAMRDAFAQSGVAFAENEQGKISFAEESAKRRAEIEHQAQQQITEYWAQGKAFQDELDAARNEGNIARYQELLSSEQALFAQDLAGRQEYIDAYYEVWQASHRSAMSYMAEAMSGMFSGFTTFFTDILSGTESLSDAWKGLGKSIVQVFAKMVAEWISSQIIMAAFGKAMQAKQYAASVAQASATAAAWAPAAAMVSLATMGGNAGPAMAGIAATTAFAYTVAVPQLASGGMTTGPTLAEIGEGHRDEVVLPLDRKVFERMGLAGGQGTTVNQYNYGDINTKTDLEELHADLGRAVNFALMGAV